MNQYTKKDFIFSVISGFITGFLAWQILNFLKIEFLAIPTAWLMLVVPVLWILGVGAGFFLSRWFPFMQQFGKFAAIGFTNFVVDIGILNILIALTGHALGVWYTLFKAIAFLVAVTHSFFWNKYWTFEAGGSRGGGGEFFKFISVNLAAAVINVAIATFVANGIDPVLGWSDELWANVAAIVGSACALVFSFVGLRLLVFKKTNQEV